MINVDIFAIFFFILYEPSGNYQNKKALNNQDLHK